MPKGPLIENRSAPPERVLVAAELISKMSYESALKGVMEQFKCSRSTAKRAIGMARAMLRQQLAEQLPEIQAVEVARLERLIDKCTDEKDYRAAVAGHRELIRVLGLAAPDRVQHSGGVAVANVTAAELAALEDMTPEQLAVIAMLDAKVPRGKT